MDKDGLSQFPDGKFDFVVMNHVLEHLANPVKAVREIFRICRDGGIVVIAIPDKDYTFDQARELTTWEHVWSDYQNKVTENSDDHYEGFLRSAVPHLLDESPANVAFYIQSSKRRREHAHVWTSESFDQFLRECFSRLKIEADLCLKSDAAENSIEYFSVWMKSSAGPAKAGSPTTIP